MDAENAAEDSDKRDEPDAAATEPDYRYTLANERTFLSWVRTALALIAGGIALETFAKDIHPSWAPAVMGIFATLLGGTLAILGYQHWRRVQEAMRLSEPMPKQLAAPILTVGMVILAVVLSLGILL